jgi:hypothetical protein
MDDSFSVQKILAGKLLAVASFVAIAGGLLEGKMKLYSDLSEKVQPRPPAVRERW